MIYAIGIDTDKTFLGFLRRAEQAGAEVEAINLRAVAREPWHFAVPAVASSSHVYLAESPLRLDPQASYFVRACDLSPVLADDAAANWRSMLMALSAFLETVEGPVVNRPGTHTHNATKPYHEWWLSQNGLRVPPSLASSSPARLRAFIAAQGPCIVKALCGARGITRIVDPAEFDTFDPISGPVHVQRYVAGDDVRAHVVGNRVIAERIRTTSVDYRSADTETHHEATEIPADLAATIIAATARLGLVFAGWDFKVDSEQRYWCLEANPMPGYDVYDRRAGGAISRALLEVLGHAAD